MKMKRYLQNLIEEKEDVMSWVVNHVEPVMDDKAKLFMSDLLRAYNQWRVDNGMAPTKLHVGGFGRLFPDGLFIRKLVCIRGHSKRGIPGVRLV